MARLRRFYLFSKLDNIFWIKIERKYTVRISNFVELAVIISMSYNIERIFYINKRKKQQLCLKKYSILLIQEEIVSVYSVQNIL